MTAASRSPAAVGPALWRMGRLLLHILPGVLIVRLRFGQLDAARRHAEIGRWATGVLRLLHIGLRTEGDLADGPTLMVANHVSWLDIVVIHAVCPQARFVSKAVVGDWPVIGTLVTGAATLMVDRQRRHDTARALDTMVQALAELTNKPAKSLHRMLSRHGNPSMDNLAVIFDAVRQRLKVELKAQTVRAA